MLRCASASFSFHIFHCILHAHVYMRYMYTKAHPSSRIQSEEMVNMHVRIVTHIQSKYIYINNISTPCGLLNTCGRHFTSNAICNPHYSYMLSLYACTCICVTIYIFCFMDRAQTASNPALSRPSALRPRSQQLIK